MTRAWIEIVLYLVVLLVAVKPLGAYMARVLAGERHGAREPWSHSSASAIASRVSGRKIR
mgnify:CR=1 FL=1